MNESAWMCDGLDAGGGRCAGREQPWGRAYSSQVTGEPEYRWWSGNVDKKDR